MDYYKIWFWRYVSKVLRFFFLFVIFLIDNILWFDKVLFYVYYLLVLKIRNVFDSN